MRVAVVVHVPVSGGITRFLLALVPHLRELDPDLELGLFASPEIAVGDHVLAAAFRRLGAEVVPLGLGERVANSPTEIATPSHGRLWRAARWIAERHDLLYEGAQEAALWYRRWILRAGRQWYEFEFAPEALRALERWDVVYLPNSFYVQPARLSTPVVATVHDLNFKHFRRNFPARLRRLLERESRFWMARFDVIVSSTRFIESEVHEFYPASAGRTSVVYLAPYSFSPPEPGRGARVVRELGLPPRFVLYPAATSAEHKNVDGFIRAAAALKRRGELVPFVVTGLRTPLIAGPVTLGGRDAMGAAQRAFRESGLQSGADIHFLEYLTNEQVDALTRSASLIVSPSLYEAGCGPAMDAWQFGVPVAFSDIPPYREQMEVLRTRAWLFDPRDPEDVARAVHEALTRREETERMVAESREGIRHYTWADVARGYLAALREAASRGRSEPEATSRNTSSV